MDLNKTQFLIEADGSLRTFRRKSVTLEFKGDTPLGPFEWDHKNETYEAYRARWQALTLQGHTVSTVWTLVETTK